jgi:hypothetical protein
MFDAEHNHCSRCNIVEIQQMSAAADAVLIVAPPTPPRIWRFSGVMPILMAGIFILLGFGLSAVLGGSISSFLIVPLTIAFGYFGGVSLEALIKHVVRSRTGSLPMDINRLIDDWFGISVGLTGLVLYLSIFAGIFLGKSIVYFLPPVPVLAMLASLVITLRKRRRITIRSVRVDRKTVL